VDGVVVAFADSGGHLPAVDFAWSVSVGRIRCHGRASACKHCDCGRDEKTAGWFHSTFCSFSKELVVTNFFQDTIGVHCVIVNVRYYIFIDVDASQLSSRSLFVR